VSPRSIVIVNPHASQVRAAASLDAVLGAMTEALARRDGTPPEVVTPVDAEATSALVREAVGRDPQDVASVVAMGGDGTVRAVAAAVAGTGVPLGILPGGTGNILAGVLGIPTRLGDAVELLRVARPRAIDLADVIIEDARRPRGSPPVRTVSAIGCGIGFDARLMATTPGHSKARWGRIAYLFQAVQLAGSVGTVPYHLVIDGRPIETEASIAMVTNIGDMVPGLVRPRFPAVPDDGLLDVFVVGARHALEGIRGLADQLLRTGTGGGPGSRTLRFRCRSARLDSTPPEPVQVDGDPSGVGALEVTVRPGALRVLVRPT
jgi:diacylglycerol kinase family enzyme